MSDIPSKDRRSTDETLAEAIDEQNTRLSNFISKALIAFGTIGIFCAIALYGFTVTLSKQGHTAKEIQDQRFDSLVTSCQAQKDHHDKAISKSKVLPVKYQIVVKLLVDQLQPRENDCKAYARSRVKP